MGVRRRAPLSVPGLVLGLAAALACSPAPEAGPAPATEAARPSAATARDLLLITVDTLRADALGFMGQDQVPTPNLDRLAAAGRVFTEAHAHNTLTLPSHTNILTGLYPYQHGVRSNAGFTLGDRVPTLATVLRDHGFATAAMVGAFPLDTRFGLARGFDVYDDRYPDGANNPFRVSQRPGDQVVDLGIRWWQDHRAGRRFLWVHLYDPHAPYAPPKAIAEAFPGRPYLGEVAAVDADLGRLLDAVAAEGPPPFVVFVADHGEGLGDHGETTHGIFAYESTLHVPLVLAGPGIERGRDDRLARHVDLLPTMLEALAVPVPEGLPGRSLLAPPPETPTVSYFEALSGNLERGWAPLRGVLRERVKYVDLPVAELYDLDADPGEAANVIGERRDQARELRGLLPRESVWPPVQGEVPADLEDHLRSLGYLTATAPLKEHYGPDDDPKRLLALDRQLHEVSEAIAEGRYPEALAGARELAVARPEMPQSYWFIAESLLELGRTPEAIAVMRDAAERGLASDLLRIQLGLSLSWVGRPGEALEVLQPLAARDDPAALSAYGHALTEAGRTQEAGEALQRSLEIDPTQSVTWERLAVVSLRDGRWADARDQASKALELDAELPHSWNNLGVALYYLGEVPAALDAWERSLAIDPDQFDTLYNVGLKAAESGQTARARDALRRFVDTAPRERYAPDIPAARALLKELGS